MLKLPQSDWLELQFSRYGLDELQQRWQEIARGMKDAQPHIGQRLWGLDPVPALLAESDWAQLEAGLSQRAQLLNLLLQDAYGQQQMLREGRLHPALYYNNPAWLQPCHGMLDSELGRLLFYAVDLVRDEAGQWWVLRDRAGTPHGFGSVLSNRRWMARAYHEIFSEQLLQPLAPAYQSLRFSLSELGQRTGEARTVMLTSAADSARSADDAGLANFLGCALVEGEDLTVRKGRLYLKLLEGLQPVDLLLRRIPDRDCDPLELGSSGWHGVVGMLQTVRAGNLVVCNSPGSGWLETPALSQSLAQLAPALLGQPLLLPDLPAHWGQALPEGRDWVARRFAGGPPLLLPEMETTDQDRWWKSCRPEQWVFQRYVRPGRFPCWYQGQLENFSGVVRCFLLATATGYRLIPGGLVRMRPPGGKLFAKDLWRLARKETEPAAAAPITPVDLELSRGGGDVPSRVAEQFYWFGRYLERCEHLLRFARTLLARQTVDSGSQARADLECLLASRAEFGPDLVSWVNGQEPDQLQSLLSHMQRLGTALRDRVSADMPRILAALQPLSEHLEGRHLLGYLEELSIPLWGLVAIARESLYRGYGFRFLEIGRRLERALLTCELLESLGTESPSWGVLDMLLEVTDSGRTYRRRYPRLEWMPVLDLLLADDTHPRSLAFQLRVLEEHFGLLPARSRVGLPAHQEALLRVRAPLQLWRPPQAPPLQQLSQLLPAISQGLGSVYLSHLTPRFQGGSDAL
ncbi:MAG: circularly permuted type 2 ATP-grasp protein [Candidatus Eremiobacteraeota bacterium]|nr:circularly permuted type 2 ATP-grasp protein [Candidatus Eremiobacteraeota bacterium]MCW5872489.1 circularly permuted type 2 ATP-grasp protein [Candidatus Eremiobacteraeota bacterium]